MDDDETTKHRVAANSGSSSEYLAVAKVVPELGIRAGTIVNASANVQSTANAPEQPWNI